MLVVGLGVLFCGGCGVYREVMNIRRERLQMGYGDYSVLVKGLRHHQVDSLGHAQERVVLWPIRKYYQHRE